METCYTRLKSQYVQPKTENAQLLQHKFANREDLGQVGAILEEALDSAGIPEQILSAWVRYRAY
jgi:hypothetical protein